MKRGCLYCGNNPVPHHLVWLDTSLMVCANAAAQRGIGRWLPFNLSSRASDAFAHWLVKALIAIRIMGISDDISRARNDRGRVLWEGAQKRGIKFSVVTMLGTASDLYIAEINGREILITGVPKPPSNNAAFDFWLDDKAIVKEKLADAGIPVPRGGSARTWRQARKIFDGIEKPAVVKPRLGSRGRHTTTSISTLEELKTAYTRAKQLCHWVIVEEHLVGSVYRCTVVGGKSGGILRGDPPRVTGDGRHTITELVEKKNASRHRLVSAVELSIAHDAFLAMSGRKRTDVLPEGVRVDVLEKIGVSYGGNSAEDTERTHPATIAILERAGAVLGDPLVGLDFIIPDIDRSPDEQKWGVTECNACPFINLHHDPVEGTPRNVAGLVWDLIEKSAATSASGMKKPLSL